MRVLAACFMALCLAGSPVIARASGAGGEGNPAPAKSTTASAANADPSDAPAAVAKADSPAKSSESMESELDQLRDLMEMQAKQLQEQNHELKQQQEQIRALESRLIASPTSSRPAAALESSSVVPNVNESPVATAISTSVAPAGSSAVTGIPATGNASGSAAPQDQSNQPDAIHYKGVTLTPGGFFAAETVWRQHALGSDVNSAFGNVPLPGQSQAHMSEFFGSGRQSRIAMLVSGKLSNLTINGYYEGDFLSSATTSNNNQSNSYAFRQRQFWGQALFNDGWQITGGQMWSLLTETGHGLDNRTEQLPQTIDAQYHIGFSWARQYGLRFVKDFDNKVWLGFSVENSQATLGVSGNPTVNNGGTTVCVTAACTGTTGTAVILPTVQTNFLLGAYGTSGGLYNPLANYSFNPSPDLIFKAAFEPGFGHYEIFGLVSEFRDRVFPCVPITGSAAPAGCPSTTSAVGAYNYNATGGGIGANARASMFAKHMDLGIHFFGGNGIGRYGSGGLADATTRPNGTLALIRNYQSLATLQFHPTPKLDINLNVGGEYDERTAYAKSGTVPNEGYGAQLFNNSGCWTETQPLNGAVVSIPTGVAGSGGFLPGSLGSCAGNTRNFIEGTLGYWYRFYRGPMGTFQFGMQYSYVVRNTWYGTGGTAGSISASGQPHGIDNMIFTSMRYYLP